MFGKNSALGTMQRGGLVFVAAALWPVTMVALGMWIVGELMNKMETRD